MICTRFPLSVHHRCRPFVYDHEVLIKEKRKVRGCHSYALFFYLDSDEKHAHNLAVGFQSCPSKIGPWAGIGPKDPRLHAESGQCLCSPS